MPYPLDQLYERLPTLDKDDPEAALLASVSPLLLAMFIDPDIKPYEHLRFLDEHLLALTNLSLYPDGPGPPPEVWGRTVENKGEYYLIGEGYSVAISDEAFDCHELLLIRPNSSANPEQATNLDRVVLKLAVSMPPRHGKSKIVTETLPLWFLLRYPDNSALMATYNQDFADKWGKNLQDVMEEVSSRLPGASDGKQLIPLTETLQNMSFRPGKDTGEINFRGIGTSITGVGWGLGIIDDPFKDQSEAMSDTIRFRRSEWYSAVFSNRRTVRRGSPPPLEVSMATRWHEKDIIGSFSVQEDGESPKDGWCVINLPGIAEARDVLGREEGASLCPQLAPLSFLLDERKKNPTWFSSLYQGRPVHVTGSLFQKTYVNTDLTYSYHHWRKEGIYYKVVGDVLKKENITFFVTVDTATSLRTSADWTVASLWGYCAEQKVLLLIDRKRERVSSEGHKAWLDEFWARHTDKNIVATGIEDKTFGTGLINELRTSDMTQVIVPIKADKDKLTRALPYAEAVNSGRVLFPDPEQCSWSVEWENEHAKFPKIKHDDQVDTGSMAWTMSRRYAYTPVVPEDKPLPNRHERTRQRVAGQGKKRHDYQSLLERIPT